MIVTHPGYFHADEVMALAVLRKIYPRKRIIRTRDPKLTNAPGIIVDVGNVYDESQDRFDHHQRGGAGERENGYPYASFGLVWKKYGREYVKALIADIDQEGIKSIVQDCDRSLVQSVDALDCGYEKSDSYSVSRAISDMNLTHLELERYSFYPSRETFEPSSNGKRLKNRHLKIKPLESSELLSEHPSSGRFLAALRFAQKILERNVISAHAIVASKKQVEQCLETSDHNGILALMSALPWSKALHELDPERSILYVVHPGSTSDEWNVRAVSTEPGSFQQLKPLPETWAGLRNKELAQVTGVNDAIFCHNARFIAVARSFEGALQLANLAMEA